MPHKDPEARKRYMLKYLPVYKAKNRARMKEYDRQWKKLYYHRMKGDPVEYAIYKEKYDEWRKEYRARMEIRERDRLYGRAKNLMKFYRLTEGDYQKILDFQTACRMAILLGKKNCVDHCHKTGLVRGLLSWKLNYALGMLGDNPQVIRTLADYLENPPAVEALGSPRYGILGQATNKKKMIYGPRVI